MSRCRDVQQLQTAYASDYSVSHASKTVRKVLCTKSACQASTLWYDHIQDAESGELNSPAKARKAVQREFNSACAGSCQEARRVRAGLPK